MPPATSAPTTARCTDGGCGSSTGTWHAAGEHAAGSMMGEGEPYEVVPYFFSDLADWAGLEYVGPATEWDEVIWRGDRDAGEFVGLLRQGREGRGRAHGRALGGACAREDAAGGGRRRGRGRGQGAARGSRQRSRPTHIKLGFSAALRAGVIGNTCASGAQIRGSSPWPAVRDQDPPLSGSSCSAGPASAPAARGA